MAILLGLIAIERSIILNGIEPESTRNVAAVFHDVIIDGLRTIGRILAVLGLVVALATLLLTRERAGEGATAHARRLGDTARRWVGAHGAALQLAVAGVACVVLIAWDRPSTTTVIVLALVAILLVGAIHLLARPEHPAPEQPEPA
jgi:hypothetical protein